MSPHPVPPSCFGAHLEQRADGIWYARERETVSYLEDGHEVCYQIEEESFWFRHRAACLKTVLQRFPPPGVIYDIGGGNGFMTRTLIEAGFEAVLVEPGETGARNARRRGLAHVLCATLGAANFPEASLPAAGLFDVLEHIDDSPAFLREIHRALAADGRLYLTVPAFPWLWSDDDLAAGHFRRYTPKSLAREVRAAGFEPLYATCLFSLLPLPLFALRSLPSLFGRRALPRKNYQRLHRQRARWLTDRLWSIEQNAFVRGRSIPFGSSCLLVARKA